MTRRPRSVLFPGPMPLADKSPGTTRHLASDGRAAREKLLVGGVRERLTLDTELAGYHAKAPDREAATGGY
jgi:hypothetical protein